jgi:hypothetical protein
MFLGSANVPLKLSQGSLLTLFAPTVRPGCWASSMRYFFNLASDYGTIPDDIGMEATDCDCAIAGAHSAIKELANESPTSARNWEGWRLEIIDENSHVVKIIILEG